MKFLMYSEAGEGAQILNRIKMEGNEVGLYIKDKIYKKGWDGLLPKVGPESFIDADTTIIFDLSGNGKVADAYRKSGHFVYGASEFADKLEHDRKFGFDIMSKAGIQTPETKEFTDFTQGIDFVRASNKRLVFKPSGKNLPCKLTYCSKNSKELVAYMQFVEKKFASEVDVFVLQEFVEGVVVSTELFCDGKRFLEPANHTVEVKKVMNDELGPSTGCSGNIVWPCDADIIVESLLPMDEICVKEQYVGQIDLNVVLTEGGEIYGLEWTPRFGYDATPTLMTMLEMDFGKFYYDAARGNGPDMKLSSGMAGGVRVTIPPYPVELVGHADPEKFSPNIGIPIQNYESYEADCYFYEVMLDDAQLVHSGGTGVILCACGLGANPEEALKRPYEIAEGINIPDKQYRTDLEKVLSKMVKEVNDYAA